MKQLDTLTSESGRTIRLYELKNGVRVFLIDDGDVTEIQIARTHHHLSKFNSQDTALKFLKEFEGVDVVEHGSINFFKVCGFTTEFNEKLNAEGGEQP